MFGDVRCISFCQDEAALVIHADTFRTHLDLLRTLFARDIKHFLIFKIQCHLQQKCRLSYSRFAAEQDERSWNETATQDTIQLTASHIDTRFFSSTYLQDRNRFRLHFRQKRILCRLVIFTQRDTFFDITIPRTTARAMTNPLRRLITTLFTIKNSLDFCHNI